MSEPTSRQPYLAVDCETTGLDLHHLARPFFVTCCSSSGQEWFWQWEVDPTSRLPQVSKDEVAAIHDLVIGFPYRLVGQNIKFDVAALSSLIPPGTPLSPSALPSPHFSSETWPWQRTEDTLIAAHVLHSGQKHDLTHLARTTPSVALNIQPLEDALEAAVKAARQIARTQYKGSSTVFFDRVVVKSRPWLIAREGLVGFPSIKQGAGGDKDKVWKNDLWLPRAVAKEKGWPVPAASCQHRWSEVSLCTKCGGHRWWLVLEAYARLDSTVTVLIWQAQEAELRSLDLWDIYRARFDAVPVVCGMERRGVPMSQTAVDDAVERYQPQSAEMGDVLVAIAKSFGHDLELPKSGVNNSLQECVFTKMRLPVVAKTDKGSPSFDKDAVALWQGTLKPRSLELAFINALADKRACDTSLAFLESYRRFWQPLDLPLVKVISGGQNGVDQAALRAAQEAGLPTGGTMPRGWRTLDGPQPELASLYGLQESAASDYPSRTDRNAQDGDATLQLYENPSSPGELCTERAVRRHGRPLIKVDLRDGTSPAEVARQIKQLDVRTLNVAGNSEATCPGIGSRAQLFLSEVFGALKEGGWYVVHPSLNITGTVTLRMSSNNPNAQQVSKRKGFNLRSCFCPPPGWEMFSLDAANIEMRIPCFEVNEPTLCDVFLNPDQPPYYGSYHLVVCHALHPELFAKWGADFKTEFESTWYQWVKNGNFALLYGAQEGTADATYRVKGAYAKFRNRFPLIAQLADRMFHFATRHGYVETIPDRSVNPRRGYPLEVGRTEWDRVKPTTPLNYHVQGTACWWMGRAMVKCQRQLDAWRAEDGFDGYMALQVHDELVFLFPKHGDVLEDREREKTTKAKSEAAFFRTSNLWRVRTMQRLMESCGPDLGVPTPVAVEYHSTSWGESVKL